MNESSNNLKSTEVLQNKEVETTDQTSFSPFNIPMIDRDFETESDNSEVEETDFEEKENETDHDEVPEFEVEEETEFEEEQQPTFNPELAELSSKTILLVLENLLPKLAFFFAEIDTTELITVELAKGTIEHLEEINENNQETLEETIKKNLKPIEAPLKAVMKQRNLNISPESMLALTLAMVLGNITFDVMKIRKQNDKLVAQLIALNTPKKEEKNKTNEKSNRANEKEEKGLEETKV